MVTSVVLGVRIALLLVFGWIVFYRVVFLRNPRRRIPSGNVVVSPADGKVVRVAKLSGDHIVIRKMKFGKVPVDTKDFLDGTLVSIFMSPLNVHYNRAPITSTVEEVVHRPGRFFNAGDLSKSLHNEHTQIVLDSVVGKVIVVQIAGFLARRISCFLKKKQKVNKGERIGLIHMGSQASILLPKSVIVTVGVGERVLGGTTIIGSY